MADLLRYIDTTAGGGGDGSSGSPWDAWDDVEADDPGTASDTLEVEVSGGDDGSQMIVSGLTVPTITITPTDDNYRINRTASNYSAAVVFDGKNVTVTGAYPFRVRQGATGGRRGIDIGPTSGNTVSIDKMIVQHEGGGSAFAAVNVDHAGTTLIKNSIVTTSISDGFNVTFGGGSGNLRVHNCLANDCAGDGFNRAGGTLNAVNCVSGNNTGNDFDGSFASKTDCASEDTTGTTGHQSITWADQFTDYTTDDFTLKSGNDLEGNGTELDSDATLPVTEDIAGTARPATAPAIGPYEPEAASSTDVTGSLDTLTITEYAASVQINRDITGTLDALVLTELGASIQLNYGIDGSLDTLALTELNGSIQINRDIPGSLDTLTITEHQATIQAFQDVNVSGSLDTLSLTEFQATIEITTDTAVSGSLDELVITEYPAAVAINRDIAGSLDTLAITEYQADIGLGLQVLGSLDQLTITEYQAAITADINVAGSLDNLAITEHQASIGVGQNVQVVGSLDSLAITEFQASVTAAQYITGSLDTLNVTEYGATITAAIAITASLDALTLTEYRATIAGDAIVQPTVTDVITLAGTGRTVTPKGTARTINLNRWN